MLGKYDCKELESIFFGEFIPPKDAKVRAHRIGLHSNVFRYVPPTKEVREKRESSDSSARLVLEALEKLGGSATSVDIAQLVDMTRNHCGIVLTKLYRKNVLNRKKVCIRNIRLYKYTLKETKNEQQSRV